VLQQIIVSRALYPSDFSLLAISADIPR